MLCVEGSNQAPLWPLCRLDCSELSCVVIGKCCCHTCLFFALPWDHYLQALLWGCCLLTPLPYSHFAAQSSEGQPLGREERGTCDRSLNLGQLSGARAVFWLKSAQNFKRVCSVSQSCLPLCDPMDCSPPGSSVHRISQLRLLEWVAISYFRGSSRSRDRIWVFCVSCTGRGTLHHYTVAH